ncbi:hypothetical protein HMPREF1574_00325 [Gardnerella pickettii JCP7659]|uniref:Uncharacterized protein n=1 Tax=Gardnerella pickettii JCP8017A TaxID=1261062 RepID=T2PKL6_9BIFI|nr:hypothetical protein HMPREF1582_00484 [Gardnerella vaginalis JCP8151A]EPI48060.1 hypothetical protein HMPREF1583_00179 [Gardnerella vaginalis JCP8151B]EPI52254.1 hypothetical protein HMPREF1577_00806 [Gardnerella pickettii JCP8017A]EPI55798.1 hypothetical protein HMPREF1574_00325 [Gardnerella pickettii JCP7659]EPI61865.1 hypothetical protein HMPREF1578_00579 [Gardnerella pickettii JCP8017B]
MLVIVVAFIAIFIAFSLSMFCVFACIVLLYCYASYMRIGIGSG